MKRLIALSFLIAAVSCSNPEDRATGNPDSKRFNSDEEKTLNRPGSVDNKPSETTDSSTSPSTSKQNVKSPTQGTNRSYGGGQDSSQQKQK